MASTVEAVIRSAVGKGATLLAGYNRRRMPRSTEPHPFLSGVHAPMSEEKTLTDLAVTGVIPAALDGRYLRIGPNPIEQDPAGYHWFIGDGMVHAIALRDGKALWYRNRWIRSTAVGAALGEPPAPGPRRGHGDTVNTNVVDIGGRTFALVEAGSYPVELSDTLEDQRYNAFDETLAGSFTAHPHRDPLTGEHHGIAYDPSVPEIVRHIVISPEGKVLRELPIAVEHGPSIHDCAITPRFAVILDLPVTFSMKALIGGHRFPFAWNPAHRARVGLLPRSGKAEPIWCDVDPCYVFHAANAYDADDGTVILDVVAYDTMFAESRRGPDATGRFERWTIDPTTRGVSRRIIDTSPQEFPRGDERRLGQPYRYAYAIAVPDDGNDQLIGATALYKHDLETGGRQVHDFGPGRFPGEFVFVPAAPDSREDEGWLIGLVIDMPRQTTDLVILDASAIAAPPVGSIRIPHRVPPGFHGNFLPRHERTGA